MMFLRIIVICLAIIPYATPVEAGLWGSIKQLFSSKEAPKATINVLIVHDKPSVILEVRGKYELFDPNKQSHISSRRHSKQGIIQPQASGLKWGEGFPGIYQLQVIPDTPKTQILVDGKEYAGTVTIYDVGGSISVVNELPLEEYLETILTQHLPESLPSETLSALAITARTLAYFEASHARNPYWAIEASHVGYQGKLLHQSEAISHAVSVTHDMVLSSSAGSLAPFPAHWASVSGARPYNTHGIISRVSLAEAEKMANEGFDASEILEKAFPDTTIQLIQ